MPVKVRAVEHEWQQSSMRVAVFFGTFDPVHENHVAMAKHAIMAHAVSHVVFVPMPDFRFKPFVSPLAERVALLNARLAIENTPQLGTLMSVHTDLQPNQVPPPHWLLSLTRTEHELAGPGAGVRRDPHGLGRSRLQRENVPADGPGLV